MAKKVIIDAGRECPGFTTWVQPPPGGGTYQSSTRISTPQFSGRHLVTAEQEGRRRYYWRPAVACSDVAWRKDEARDDISAEQRPLKVAVVAWPGKHRRIKLCCPSRNGPECFNERCKRRGPSGALHQHLQEHAALDGWFDYYNTRRRDHTLSAPVQAPGLPTHQQPNGPAHRDYRPPRLNGSNELMCGKAGCAGLTTASRGPTTVYLHEGCDARALRRRPRRRVHGWEGAMGGDGRTGDAPEDHVATACVSARQPY
jgi:hypothetical protein